MTDPFFADPGVLPRFRWGPLDPYIDSFAPLLLGRGYARTTAKEYLRLAAVLSRWLARRNLGVEDLDDRRVAEFLNDRRERGIVGRSDGPPLRLLLKHLRDRGVIPPFSGKPEVGPLDRFESEFSKYLAEERGLARPTILYYLPLVRKFLSDRFGTGPIRVGELSVTDISDFLLCYAPTVSRGRAKLMATALRSFFRFLRLRGEIATDLAASVPSVADWRLWGLPKFLRPEEVESLLDACDRSRPTGRRDYAILLLLARLGLRAGEVVALTLDDIDWRAGEITVRGKGRSHGRLPIPQDVGEALSSYLHQGRPLCSTRRFFIRAWAPRTGFASSAAITTIVRRALARAGLSPLQKGAHLLRHSLATRLLREGASLAEIGQILGHRSPQTTEIYAKVDLSALHAIAQPWPSAGGDR